MHIFHKWHMWSEPKEAVWQSEVWGMIQDRTCAKCGKYSVRRV